MTTWSLPYKCLTCSNKMDVYPRVPCAEVFCSKCGISQFQRVVWVGVGPEPLPIPSNSHQMTEVAFGPVLGHIKDAHPSTHQRKGDHA